MATMVPGPQGGDLLSLIMGLKNLKQRQSEFSAEQDIKKQQMALDQQRAQTEQELAALSMIGSLTKVLPKDTKFEDATVLHPILQRIGIDPGKLSGSVLNPSTGEDILNSSFVKTMQDLQASTDPADKLLLKQITERGLDRLFTGSPVSAQDLSNEDTLSELKRIGMVNFKQHLEKDPKLAYEVGAKAAGVDLPVEFDFGGKHYKFDSEAAGQLAIAFARLAQEGTYQTAQLSTFRRSLLVDMSKTLIDQANKNGLQLTMPQAMRLTSAEAEGKLDDAFVAANPDIAPMVQLIRSGHAAGVGNLNLMMQFTEQGQGQRMLSDIAGADWFKSLPTETKDAVLQGMSKTLRQQGVAFPEISKKRSLGHPLSGKMDVQFTPVPGIGTPARAAPADATDTSRTPKNGTEGKAVSDLAVQAAANIYGQTVGGVTVDDAYLQRKGFSPEQIAAVKQQAGKR